MDNTGIILIVVVVAIIMLIIWIMLLRSSRRVNLTRPPEGEKPKWMSTNPPQETMSATQAEGEGVTLYNYDKGEKVAAAFAEQIEDILRAQMSNDPYLKSLNVDFGTGADGGLVISVDGKDYTTVEQIPDLRLREAITRAVATYNGRGK
jgi:hypothetical protein